MPIQGMDCQRGSRIAALPMPSKLGRLSRRVSLGQSVTGVVVAKAHFGAWLDIGAGFPALLEITCIAGLTPERYRADDWCPKGSEVTAEVAGFNDRNHQVSLSQVKIGER